MTADKREIRTAEGKNVVDLNTLNAESHTWNCNPRHKMRTLTLHDVWLYKKKWKNEWSINMVPFRSQTLIINTYPIHNFRDGSDWYIFKLG